jgi:hypothetical protein
MSQKRSEKSWDEVFAELDAAGPWPDDFLSESDLHTPLRAVMEKVFEIAEAGLRLEGMAPGPRYYALKERVLDGEVTPDQAVAELMNAEHQQDMEIARRVMNDNREALCALADADQQTGTGGAGPEVNAGKPGRAERASEGK